MTFPMSQLEVAARERDWMRARARDRRWPSQAAWARALLKLAGPALIRARAQARLCGSETTREFFALMAGVERIADERFVVVRLGDAFRVSGPRQPNDPRPAVISRAARLAGISHNSLLAEADQQENAIRRSRRSNLRGLEVAERYMAGLPRSKVQTRPAPPTRPDQRRTARTIFAPCGGGEFVFVGVETTPLDVDIERLLEDEFEPSYADPWPEPEAAL